MLFKQWSRVTLTLITMFSFTSQIHSVYYDYLPDNHSQLMGGPPPNSSFTVVNEGMSSPAAAFSVANNNNGEPIIYGLPECMIRHIGPDPVGMVEYGGRCYTTNCRECSDNCNECSNDCGECCCSNGSFGGVYRLGLEFAAGRYIAIDQNYGGVTLFAVPESPFDSTHALIDLRAFKLEKKNWAGSVGVGFRHVDRSNKKVYGLNVYYDYLDQFGTFNQVGVGFELFSRCWEFHVNGYLPVGKENRVLSTRIREFDGGFVGIFRTRQFALRGIEVSGGGRWMIDNNLFLYVAPGFYMYDNKDLGNFQGVEGTVEVSWNQWISLRVNASYDRKFRGRAQGVIALNIPLNFGCDWGCGCNVCSCCPCDMLCLPVRRNDLIFLKRCCSVERNWDDCGRPVQ